MPAGVPVGTLASGEAGAANAALLAASVLALSDERGPASVAQTLYVESEASRAARAVAQEQRKTMLAFERLPALKPQGKDRRQLSRLRGRG